MIKRFSIICICIASAFSLSAYELQYPSDESESDLTGHFLHASVGYGCILSKVENNWDSGNPKFGLVVNATYEWIGKKKMGGGFLYKGYFSNKGTYGSYDTSLGVNYFAPQFCARFSSGNEKWDFHTSFGLGLVATRDCVGNSKNYDYGVGYNANFGADYKLSSHFALTGIISLLSASVKQEYLGKELSSEASSLYTLDLTLGLTYHF